MAIDRLYPVGLANPDKNAPERLRGTRLQIKPAVLTRVAPNPASARSRTIVGQSGSGVAHRT